MTVTTWDGADPAANQCQNNITVDGEARVSSSEDLQDGSKATVVCGTSSTADYRLDVAYDAYPFGELVALISRPIQLPPLWPLTRLPSWLLSS
jgi:hypothetical protein